MHSPLIARAALFYLHPMLVEIMGNSVGIITRHYKRTLSLAQAEALFVIMP